MADLKLSQLQHTKKNYLDPALYESLPNSNTITGTEARRSCSQGPAAYNVSESFKALKQKTQVSVMRPISQQAAHLQWFQPGPQTYTLPEQKRTHGYMSTTSHSKYKQEFQTPAVVGPGSYNVQDRAKTKSGFSIKGRPNESKWVNENGPGAYDISEILDRRWHKGIIMKARYAEHVERTPGPYEYNPKYEATSFRKSKPEFSFPHSKRFQRFPDIPGVGTYNLDRQDWGSGITMGSRTFGDHF